MKKFFSLTGNFVMLAISAVVLIAIGLTAVVLTLPDIGALEKCFTTSMYEVNLCSTGPNYVKLKSVSPFMVHALIAAEDGSFYTHKGFDWHEIEESFTTNLKSGKIARGGSTLTQQLAKNAFLGKEKSFLRKIKEAYLANAIEHRYKKDFILEKYLNVVEFGPNLYGIKAASLQYFRKSPSELHPLEAAWLAHLLPNPKVYSQGFRAGKLTPYSRKMVAVILKRMTSFGKLSKPAYDTAMANLGEFPWSGLGLASFEGRPSYDIEAPHVKASDLEMDEQALEELIQESERNDSPPASPARDSAPVDSGDSTDPIDYEE